MSRLLNDLDPQFRPLVFELLARFTEAGIPVMIVNTRRTAAEQAINIANGTSWTTHSKHLDGLAIDICPYSIYQLKGPDKLEWDSADPVWQRMGVIGEKLGMRWGGRFKPPAKPDLGHFEYAPADKIKIA